MEESGEVHSEGNKACSVKNRKRKLKTPAQVIALEKFYDGHKYPTEEMKSKLAEELELTERQISGWFCHRRLKDKKLFRDGALATSRQDRSSDVLQDCGSGLRQDSCGSTKQGEYKHGGPREVESEIFDCQDFPAVDLANVRGSYNHSRDVGFVDDTSSESSSASEDGFYTRRVDRYDFETTRCTTGNKAIIPIAKHTKNVGYKPSGYLKVKGETENAAITAVKRQLGMLYQEYGPPLGVEFEPLPPGAFQSPIRNPVYEQYNDVDFAMQSSPYVPRVRKKTTHMEVVDYDSKTRSRDLHTERKRFGTIHGCGNRRSEFYSHSKQQSSTLNNDNNFPGKNSCFDMYEDSAGETSVYSKKRDDTMMSEYCKEGRRSYSVSHRLAQYGGKLGNEQTSLWLRNHDNIGPNMDRKNDYLKYKPSNTIPNCGDSFDRNERRPSLMRMAKEDRKKLQEYSDPVAAKVHQTIKMPVANQVGEELLHQDYVKIQAFAIMPSQVDKIRGNIPFSLSEDETEETGSSLDLEESGLIKVRNSGFD